MLNKKTSESENININKKLDRTIRAKTKDVSQHHIEWLTLMKRGDMYLNIFPLVKHETLRGRVMLALHC